MIVNPADLEQMIQDSKLEDQRVTRIKGAVAESELRFIYCNTHPKEFPDQQTEENLRQIFEATCRGFLFGGSFKP